MAGLAAPLSEYLLALTGDQQTLLVANPTGNPVALWATPPAIDEAPPNEKKWTIPPRAKIEIPLTDFQPATFLRLESSSTELKLYWKQKASVSWTSLTWGSSNELSIATGPAHLSIWISNTSPVPQKVDVIGADNGVVYQSVQLKAFSQAKIVYRGTARALRLRGESRLAAVAEDALTGVTYSFRAQRNSRPLIAGSAVFELTNSDFSQSFAVEITDPRLQAAARQQIADPQAVTPHLLIAKIALGPDGINQDFSSPFSAPWSWHVEKVFRFADFGSIDCDGNPNLIEKASLWWLAAKGGTICFWDYKVVRELTP